MINIETIKSCSTRVQLKVSEKKNLTTIFEELLKESYSYALIVKLLLKTGYSLDEIDIAISNSSFLTSQKLNLQDLFFDYIELEEMD